MRLLAGSANLPLAQSISAHLNTPLVETEISTFPNGEKRVWIKEHIAGEDVVFIQSFSNPVDEHILEFLLMTDAIERLGAGDVHLMIPWLGYSLQDKVFRPGEAIAAKVIANLVSNTYVKRVYLLDLHNTSTPGFFSIPSTHLTAVDLFVNEVKKRFEGKEIVVVSPDFGGLKRAGLFADLLQAPLVNVDKNRDLTTGKITSVDLHGSVKGKIALLFDDVIVSGGTVVEVSQLLKKEGAKETHFFTSHGPLVPGAVEKLQASSIDTVTTTNSISHGKLPKKFKELDIAPMICEALENWL